MRLKSLALVVFLSVANWCVAQSTAYVVYNHWVDELDGYNPQQYFDELLPIVAKRIGVKEMITTASNNADTVTAPTASWVREQISGSFKGKPGYYVVMDHYLKVPTISINKVFFGSAKTTSKYFFAINIYNSDGVQIGADTIVTRGCIASVFEKEKGERKFYNSYKVFIDDMNCHLARLRKQVLLKPLKKQAQ